MWIMDHSRTRWRVHDEHALGVPSLVKELVQTGRVQSFFRSIFASCVSPWNFDIYRADQWAFSFSPFFFLSFFRIWDSSENIHTRSRNIECRLRATDGGSGEENRRWMVSAPFTGCGKIVSGVQAKRKDGKREGFLGFSREERSGVKWRR